MILIFAGTLFVNPITVGLGPLRNSDALQTLQNLAKTDTTARWASSGFYFDALIMSSAVPQVSGQQFLAPNKKEWHKIDPSEKFLEFWNRGQSYVNFQLAPGNSFTIWNPSPDVIQVVGDPCDKRFAQIHLNWFVVSENINSECLLLRKKTTWLEGDLFIFQVQSKVN
jgi:hypothetical protein